MAKTNSILKRSQHRIDMWQSMQAGDLDASGQSENSESVFPIIPHKKRGYKEKGMAFSAYVAQKKEGKLRKALSSTKTGLWTKEAVKAKQENRELLSQGKSLVEEAQRKLELWERIKAGDSDALCELTKQRFGGDPRVYDE